MLGTTVREFTEPNPPLDYCYDVGFERLAKMTIWNWPDYLPLEDSARSWNAFDSITFKGFVGATETQYAGGEGEPWRPDDPDTQSGQELQPMLAQKSVGRVNSQGGCVTAASIISWNYFDTEEWSDPPAYDECHDTHTRSHILETTMTVATAWEFNGAPVDATSATRNWISYRDPFEWNLPHLLSKVIYSSNPAGTLLSGVSDGQATLWAAGLGGFVRKQLKPTLKSNSPIAGRAIAVNNLGQAILEGGTYDFWQNGTAYTLKERSNWIRPEALGKPIAISDNTGLILVENSEGAQRLLLPVELRSPQAKNDGHYDLSKHDSTLYPRPGNVQEAKVRMSLENALTLFFEDCADNDQIVARTNTHFDLKAGTGSPAQAAGISWQTVEKPPNAPEPEPVSVTRSASS